MRRTILSLLLVGISGWGAWMGGQGTSTPPAPLPTCPDAEIAQANAALPAYASTAAVIGGS